MRALKPNKTEKELAKLIQPFLDYCQSNDISAVVGTSTGKGRGMTILRGNFKDITTAILGITEGLEDAVDEEIKGSKRKKHARN